MMGFVVFAYVLVLCVEGAFSHNRAALRAEAAMRAAVDARDEMQRQVYKAHRQ